MNSIQPTSDRIVVRTLTETTTAGGIVLPESADKESSLKGVVVAVGPGKRNDDGTYQTPELKAGNVVLFGKYAGTEIKVDGQDLYVMREDDVIAIFTTEKETV
jgi:chaperonin GroES